MMRARPGTETAARRRGLPILAVPVLAVLGVLALLVLAGSAAPRAAAQTTTVAEDGTAADGGAGEAPFDGQVVTEGEAEDGDEAVADGGAAGEEQLDAGSEAEDDESDREVRRIVGLLAGVGAVALLLTALFWYHTIPSRRVIAARRRRARASGRDRPPEQDGADSS